MLFNPRKLVIPLTVENIAEYVSEEDQIRYFINDETGNCVVNPENMPFVDWEYYFSIIDAARPYRNVSVGRIRGDMNAYLIEAGVLGAPMQGCYGIMADACDLTDNLSYRHLMHKFHAVCYMRLILKMGLANGATVFVFRILEDK